MRNTAQTLINLSLAFDDLQRLGNLDLELNYPFIRLVSPPTGMMVKVR